jgi:glycosyltransferase involved in cell wall biosynthesis
VVILRVVTLGSALGRFGGPFDTAIRQAQLLAAHGQDVRALYGVERGDEPTIPRTPGLTPVPVPVRALLRRWPFSSLVSVAALRQIWRQAGHADAVHVSIAWDLLPAAAAVIALLRRRRLVLQPHGMLTTTSARSRLLDAPPGALLRRADRIIALTEREAHALADRYGVDLDRVTVLGNPVDPEATDQERPSAPAGEALFLARLHPRKRPEDFVGAARRADAAGWPDRYLMIGPDGGMLERLRPNIDSLGNLEYAGPVPAAEVAGRVARAGVFVLCSEDEPWGNVLISALAMGVPCVLTASCALADDLGRRGAAIVVPDRDPQALATAVHDVLASSELQETLGRAGRAFVEDVLSPARQAEQLLSAYSG